MSRFRGPLRPQPTLKITMKFSPRYPGRNLRHGVAFAAFRGTAAFTLSELLVALAVMTMMLTMFTQIIGSSSAIWAEVKGSVDNYAEARDFLDGLQVDLSKAVIRRDLGAFSDTSGNPNLAFYTERAGVDAPATDRQLQLVSYALQSSTLTTTMVLQRSVEQISWSDAGSLSFGTSNSLPKLGSSTTDSENTVQGILAFSITFLNADGTLATTFSVGASRAVTVSMVVLADRTQKRLSTAQKTTLENKFKTVASNANTLNSVESLWQSQIVDSSSFWQGYPLGTASDIRIASRTYYLPVEGAN